MMTASLSHSNFAYHKALTAKTKAERELVMYYKPLLENLIDYGLEDTASAVLMSSPSPGVYGTLRKWVQDKNPNFTFHAGSVRSGSLPDIEFKLRRAYLEARGQAEECLMEVERITQASVRELLEKGEVFSAIKLVRTIPFPVVRAIASDILRANPQAHSFLAEESRAGFSHASAVAEFVLPAEADEEAPAP